MGIGAVAELAGGGAGGTSGILPSIQRLVEVDGNELAEEIDGQVERVTVIDRLRMPDSFVLVVRDPGHGILQRAGLEIGAKVRISTTTPGGDSPEPLMYGEVTAIEAAYDRLGMRAVVRGYDLLHRLSAGRKTKTFENVTLSDVATAIAEEAGLEADVDDSGGTIDHLIQANTSDLDFLYQLAGRAGFDVGVDEGKLLFKRPTRSSEAPGAGELESAKPSQLIWSHNLLEFQARVSAVAQVTEVKVRGWDMTAKEPVIGQAEAETSTAKVPLSPVDLADAVGGQSLVVVDMPVDDQGSADELAKTIAEQVASAAYEATGVAVGSPSLKAGQAVSISNVDAALAGDWVITTARHEFGAGPYRTHLEFSGRQDRSLLGLVRGSGDAGRTAIPGVVVGLVTDNDDPEGLGRVKVAYPWLGDEAVSYWARLAMPGAGNGYGTVWIPQVGDEVVVTFQHGDISHPIVLGGLWNGSDAAPLGDGLFEDGSTKRAGFVSRLGHRLIFFDDPDESGIALISADDRFRISLNETMGRLHVYFDGDLEIDGTGDVKLKADGAVTIEAGSSFDLKAGGNMTIKGAKVAIN